MKATWARVLVLTTIVLGMIATSAIAFSSNASAAGFSGTWVSRVSGEGYVQQDVIYRWHYDIELKLTESGSYVYGTIKTTLVLVDLKVSSYPPWPYEVPQVNTYDVDGNVVGSTLAMTINTGDYPTYTLTVNGNLMTGSGSYYSAGALINGVFDLKKGSLFGLIDLNSSTTTVVASAVSIAVAIAAIAVASAPVGIRPSVTRVPGQPQPWQPMPQGQTGTGPSPIGPDGAVPVGGAGIQQSVAPPQGGPLSPREHFMRVSQDPPRCPIHGNVALVAHFKNAAPSDPGSWFCPRCGTYPWGRT